MIALLINAEHCRDVQSSSVQTALCLFIAALLDIAKIRSYRRYAGTEICASLSIGGVALKFALVALLGIAKQDHRIESHLRTTGGANSSYSFWSPPVLNWLRRTFFFGLSKYYFCRRARPSRTRLSVQGPHRQTHIKVAKQ